MLTAVVPLLREAGQALSRGGLRAAQWFEGSLVMSLSEAYLVGPQVSYYNIPAASYAQNRPCAWPCAYPYMMGMIRVGVN